MLLCHPLSTYAPLAGLDTIFCKQVIVAVSLKDIVCFRDCLGIWTKLYCFRDCWGSSTPAHDQYPKRFAANQKVKPTVKSASAWQFNKYLETSLQNEKNEVVFLGMPGWPSLVSSVQTALWIGWKLSFSFWGALPGTVALYALDSFVHVGTIFNTFLLKWSLLVLIMAHLRRLLSAKMMSPLSSIV